LAQNSCERALELAQLIKDIPQVEVTRPVESNAVFAKITQKWLGPLRKEFFFYVWDGFIAEYNPKLVRNLISSLRIRVDCINIENHYGGRYILKQYQFSKINIKDFLFEVIDQAKHVFAIFDPNIAHSPFVYVNKHFSNVFNYTYDEVLGQRFSFLLYNDIHENGTNLIEEVLLKKEAISARLTSLTKNGDLVNYNLTLSPIIEDSTNRIKFIFGLYAINN
jgi:PAS domain S-box-containing protein